MITIPTLAPRGGRVAWYDWRRIGFEFDNPLSEAVLAAVRERSNIPFVGSWTLDDL